MTQQSTGMLIWSGRIHLGDDPGIFGDATYAGLRVELPVTLYKYDDKASRTDDMCFAVAAEHVSSESAPRHEVTLYAFERASSGTWERMKVAGPVTFDGAMARAKPSRALRGPYLAVHVEVDTGAPPGLYNDLVVTSLVLESTTCYAEFGFRPNQA